MQRVPLLLLPLQRPPLPLVQHQPLLLLLLQRLPLPLVQHQPLLLLQRQLLRPLQHQPLALLLHQQQQQQPLLPALLHPQGDLQHAVPLSHKPRPMADEPAGHAEAPGPLLRPPLLLLL
jgi:hypothetical protein